MKEILLLFLSIQCLEATSRLDPLVSTAKGLIKGIAAEDGDYSMFLGVPYAAIDEDNPFGDSKPQPNFNGTFEATSDPVVCPQYAEGTAIGDINCLNLNIYVPNSATSSNKLPVMVYIPGGAFIHGNGNRQNLGPKFLVKHDVIVVNINYRLGLYGFLCVDEPGYNNQGIKDQILALKWVRDNIGEFGGDVNQITAFGQSAGAMSLDLHLLVNEGLFQRVIIQSGTALTPWTIGKINNSMPINIANAMGFETDDLKDALNYLKTAPVLDVIQKANDQHLVMHNGHPLTKPCLEPANEKAFLTDYPINIKPKVEGLDIMIGHAFREVSFQYPDSDKSYYENYKFDIELIQDFDEVLDESDIRHLYIGDKETDFSVRHEILDFGSDFNFVHPTERSVKKYLENGANNVYWYLFAYTGERNRNRIRHHLTSEGASHGDDIGYLWTSDLFNEEPNDEDQRMIEIMTTLWTNFAKYGNPTPSEPTELIPFNWQPVDQEHRPYLLLDNAISLENRPFTKRMAFWDIYYKLHSDKIKGLKK